jgi:hypothetical protein
VLVALAYAFGEHVLTPLVQPLVWSLIRAVTGWPEFESPVLFVEQIITVGGATGLVMLAMGVILGRRTPTRTLDGYWFANPVSIALGYVLYHLLIGSALPYSAYKYWNTTMWIVQVVLLSPVYAWLVHVSAARVGARRRRAPES